MNRMMKYSMMMVAIVPIFLSLLVPNAYAGEANPYGDLLSVDVSSDVTCHDRKDYSDTTGLYTCNDFSHTQDWIDCPDVSGYDYDGYESQRSNFFPDEGTKEFNDIKECVDDGYDDGRNEPFSRDRYDECDVFDYLQVNSYYDAFINGCQSVEGNTEEDCERATD
jgi:hypothetical protein